MTETVYPNLLFLAKPGTALISGQEYEAHSNRNGAITGVCPNGELLGVRPGEFVFVTVPAWVHDIWAGVDLRAVDGAEIEEEKE